MAAEKQPKPESNFYFVRNHKLRQSVTEKNKTDDTKSEVNGDKIYYYDEFDMVRGRLRKVYVHEETDRNDSSKSWKILNVGLLSANGEFDWVQMYFSSREADSFLKRLPNIDLTKDITLSVMKTQDNKNKDKYHTMINVYQMGVKPGDEKESEIIVPYMWNKDNPGKLPRLEQIKVKGQDVWDNSKMLEFYEKMLAVKMVEIPNVVRVTKGMDVKPEALIFTENEELGIKVCTGFEGKPFETEAVAVAEVSNEIKPVEENPIQHEVEGNEVVSDDDLPF